MAGKKRRSLARRRKLARQWQGSGLTAQEFYEEHRVGQSSLRRWVCELRASEGPTATPAGFVEIASVAPPAPRVRLVVGTIVLEFDELPPVEYVTALWRAAC